MRTLQYHSFKTFMSPGMSDAERGAVHALDPQTLIAFCGFTGAYPVGPMAITCERCMEAARRREKKGGDV
jgi:hypothetical protein